MNIYFLLGNLLYLTSMPHTGKIMIQDDNTYNPKQQVSPPIESCKLLWSPPRVRAEIANGIEITMENNNMPAIDPTPKSAI